MTDPFKADVSEDVVDASKAVNATLVQLGTLAALVVTVLSDGSVSGVEVGTLATAALGAAASVLAVWKTKNKVK